MNLWKYIPVVMNISHPLTLLNSAWWYYTCCISSSRSSLDRQKSVHILQQLTGTVARNFRGFLPPIESVQANDSLRRQKVFLDIDARPQVLIISRVQFLMKLHCSNQDLKCILMYLQAVVLFWICWRRVMHFWRLIVELRN